MRLVRKVQRVWVGLALVLVLAGCAPSNPLKGMQKAEGKGGAANGSPAAGGAQVPAAPSEYAPGVPTAAGVPAAAKVTLRKMVQIPANLTLYRGPGEWHERYVPGSPLTLPYGAFWNGWLGLRSDRGLLWLPSEGRWEMFDEDGDGAAYLVEPGRLWSLRAKDGLKVQVTRPSPGIFRVEVTGAPEAAAVQAYAESRALQIQFPAYRPLRSRIDPLEDGFASVHADPTGLLLEFTSLPGVTLLTNQPGLLRLELRPRLQKVARRTEGDTEALAVSGLGYLPSVVRRSPGSRTITWLIQGGRPDPGAIDLPTGIKAEITEEGTAISLTSDRPVRIRLTGTGTELLLLRPGLAGKRVVIDPGHGAGDTGTAAPWGSPEKQHNLEVSLLLARELEARGARVLLLRTGDTAAQIPEAMRATWNPPTAGIRELSTRAAIANWYDADALISVHHNGGGAGSRGTETYWHTNLNADRSEQLARLLQEAMLAQLGTADRGVIRRSFAMVRLPHAPAALIEIGFLTNAAEARYITAPETQAQIAAALARAFERFFAPAD